MKRQPFLTFDFKKMSGPALAAKCNFILTSMTGNKFFPRPNPSLAIVSAAAKQFSAALVLAKSGDKVKIAAKNTEKDALIALLVKLSAYVMFEADGDVEKLTSSGFTLSATVQSTRARADINGVKVVQGKNSGELLVKIPRIKGAIAFVVLYGPAPIVNDSWKTIPNADYINTLSGLIRGTEYSVRVAVTGADGNTNYSAIINIIVT